MSYPWVSKHPSLNNVRVCKEIKLSKYVTNEEISKVENKKDTIDVIPQITSIWHFMENNNTNSIKNLHPSESQNGI